MVSLATKAAAYLLNQHDRKDQLLIERGIDYWTSPDGAFVPVPPRVSNADIMRELIDPQSLTEEEDEAFRVDPNMFAISRGWTRVRLYPSQQIGYVDFGAGRQRTHTRSVLDLLDQLQLSSIRLRFTDEQGNYISP